MRKGIVICSGGMDSVTLAHMMAESTGELMLVSFDYGQRHVKEIEYARKTAAHLGARHGIIPMRFMADYLHGSALTSPEIDVPEGHYADENMKLTVVPNRNAIMLNIAIGIAVAEEADFVATGVHSGDHAIYPDCRPLFISSMNQLAKVACEGFILPNFEILAPFINMPKDGIVRVGVQLKHPVDYSKTWSCYKGGAKHCGKCGTCVERKEAFELAGVGDPTDYEA